MRRSLLLAFAALAGAASIVLLRPHAPASPAPAPTNASPAAPPAAVPAAPLTAPAKADAPAPAAEHARELELPDGSFVPSLNGTVGAPPLQRFWGNTPWSPIVGTERSDAGVDWYVHADGSRSTTEMKWRSDLGRLDAMTRVAHPGPVPGPAAR